MFDGLKKKLTDAIKGFVKKETDQPEPQAEFVAGKAQEKQGSVQVQPQESKPPAASVSKPKETGHESHPPQHEKEAAKVSLKTKLAGVFSKEITLNSNEVDDFAEELKTTLLESDVSYQVAESFVEHLKERLSKTKLNSKDIRSSVTNEIRDSLFDVLGESKRGMDLLAVVKERAGSGNTPVKILFLGPNGTGKTTTMAKLAYLLKKNGVTSVLSASDTFRAAAIEQTVHHAEKVGVPVIKSTYGADPASIAFDAIAYAKAHGIQVVLIDSAGRQETNKNLITEMQKIHRVAKPDITLFVGESTAGNALLNQIEEFSKFMKIDGVILTKLDCDAKGGNAISIAYATGIPILFIGTGESYEALLPYTPEFIVNAILGNN